MHLLSIPLPLVDMYLQYFLTYMCIEYRLVLMYFMV